MSKYTAFLQELNSTINSNLYSIALCNLAADVRNKVTQTVSEEGLNTLDENNTKVKHLIQVLDLTNQLLKKTKENKLIDLETVPGYENDRDKELIKDLFGVPKPKMDGMISQTIPKHRNPLAKTGKTYGVISQQHKDDDIVKYQALAKTSLQMFKANKLCDAMISFANGVANFFTLKGTRNFGLFKSARSLGSTMDKFLEHAQDPFANIDTPIQKAKKG